MRTMEPDDELSDYQILEDDPQARPVSFAIKLVSSRGGNSCKTYPAWDLVRRHGGGYICARA